MENQIVVYQTIMDKLTVVELDKLEKQKCLTMPLLRVLTYDLLKTERTAIMVTTMWILIGNIIYDVLR